MRIAIDVSQIIYEGTGVANYTENLVKSLLSIDNINEYILFGISFRGKKKIHAFYEKVKKLNEKIQLIYLPIPTKIASFLGNDLHRVNIEAYLGSIDIYHSSDWIQLPAKAKKITTIHDMVIYKFPHLSSPYIINTHKKRLEWVKKDCNLIIADSNATKKDIKDILKIPEYKIEVIYPGIDKKFKPKNLAEINRIKEKYGISQNYILSVGTQEPRKNLINTIKAYDYLLTNYKKVPQLMLVGKTGWGKPLEFSDNIRYLGYVESADLPAIYSGADLFVYPSLYEGFGLPILEAMSCGVPVVTSNRGSLKEIGGDAVLYSNPENFIDIANKINLLLNNKNKFKEMKNNGIERAKKFSWKNSAEKILMLYNKLINS